MTDALRSGLEEALRYGGATHALDDVLQQIGDGSAQLWEADGAVIVTEVHDTPRARVLHFWLATGELDAVVGLSRSVLGWGRGMGCTQATLSGRKGWEKVLKAEGWSSMMTLMGRPING